MLDHRTFGQLPPSIQLTRNGRPLEAGRVEVGRLAVGDGLLWIADSAWVDQVPPLPIRVPHGTHGVFTYIWQHASGPINVCVVIAFGGEVATKTRRLRVTTDIRPDLTEGVIVDSGEIGVRCSSSPDTIVVTSGLGDGYYGVFANDAGREVQSVVVDFELWRVERYALSTGQELDEYGLLDQSPEALAREQEAIQRERQDYLDRQAEADARITDRRCPACGKPLPSYRKTCKHCGLKVV